MVSPEIAGVEKKSERKRRLLGPPTHAFTVAEFCDAHRISRSQYYKLKKKKLGPAETKALDKIIITAESAAAWRRKHTDPPTRTNRYGRDLPHGRDGLLP
jgi:hypothetical protein